MRTTCAEYTVYKLMDLGASVRSTEQFVHSSRARASGLRGAWRSNATAIRGGGVGASAPPPKVVAKKEQNDCAPPARWPYLRRSRRRLRPGALILLQSGIKIIFFRINVHTNVGVDLCFVAHGKDSGFLMAREVTDWPRRPISDAVGLFWA